MAAAAREDTDKQNQKKKRLNKYSTFSIELKGAERSRVQNDTKLHRNKGLPDHRYWDTYPYWGSGIGYGPVKVRTPAWETHEFGWRDKYETRLAVYIPPRQSAISCCRHNAYSNT